MCAVVMVQLMLEIQGMTHMDQAKTLQSIHTMVVLAAAVVVLKENTMSQIRLHAFSLEDCQAFQEGRSRMDLRIRFPPLCTNWYR